MPATAPPPTSTIAAIAPHTPDFTKAVLALFCAGFATFSMLYCVQPLLPLLARHFGISAAASSLALSLSTLSLALALLPAGALAETVNRKHMMSAALALACGAALLCAMVDSWPLLLALRVLLGLVLAGLPALAMAYVSEEFEKGSVASAMGLYIGGTVLGGLLGRTLSALLADLGGWPAALGGIGLLAVLALLLFAWLLPPSRLSNARQAQARQARAARAPALRTLLGNFGRHLRNRALRRLFMQGFLLMGCFVAMFNYVGFHLEAPPFSLTASASGLLFLTYAGGILSAGWAGRLSRRLGSRRALCGAIAAMLLGVLLCAIDWLPLLVLGVTLFTMAFFAAHSMVSSLVGARAEGAKAQASALYLCFYYLGSSAVGYAAGYLWQHGGWLALLALLGALLTAAGMVARRI